MNEMIFRIRSYSKRELTKLYFPDTVNEESAIANLRNLMRHNPDLIAELKKHTITLITRRLHLSKLASSSIISVNRKRGLKPLVIHFPSR